MVGLKGARLGERLGAWLRVVSSGRTGAFFTLTFATHRPCTAAGWYLPPGAAPKSLGCRIAIRVHTLHNREREALRT